MFWLYTVGTFIFETAASIGKLLAPSTVGELLVGFTWADSVVQVYVIVNALQSTPLKLSFADMAYVAGAPIARAAPVIVGFIRQVGLAPDPAQLAGGDFRDGGRAGAGAGRLRRGESAPGRGR